MPKAKIIRDTEGKLYGLKFLCPGCTGDGSFKRIHMIHVAITGEVESGHTVGAPHWSFNGDFDRPTFQPSVLASHPIEDEDDKVVGLYTCHSFVTDGRIQYLGDCSHALKGQTVDLPEMGDDDAQ